MPNLLLCVVTLLDHSTWSMDYPSPLLDCSSWLLFLAALLGLSTTTQTDSRDSNLSDTWLYKNTNFNKCRLIFLSRCLWFNVYTGSVECVFALVSSSVCVEVVARETSTVFHINFPVV